MKPRLWPICLASAAGIVILLGLGVWQVKRLGQKTALIASLEQRMKAEPISLTDALLKRSNGEDVEYVKVKISASPDAAHNLRKLSSVNGSPGWEIITPFKFDGGSLVLVDMGTVAENQPFVLTPGPQSIEGIIRIHNKGRGFFDVDNDPAQNLWYWWDLPAMLTGIWPNIANEAPFIVQKLPIDGDTNPPFVQKPKIELANNHLGYAITWFGLAAALAGVTGFYLRSLRKADA